MNWKTEAAAAIAATPVAVVTTTASDTVLADALQAKLEANEIAGRDVDFARSLLAGFKKWTSFTDRQRPHVERLVKAEAAPAAPVASPDADLATMLTAALEWLGAGDRGFGESLLAGFAKWGRFSDRQRPYAKDLLARAERAAAAQQAAQATISTPPATPVAVQPVAPQKAYTGLTGVVSLDKFARFTVGDLQLSLKNDGSVIWVKWTGVVAGCIDSATGHYRATRRYLTDAAQRECVAELDRINADPLGAAQANGIATGRCSCCGRALTDPVSIGFGIGPVCRERGWSLG